MPVAGILAGDIVGFGSTVGSIGSNREGMHTSDEGFIFTGRLNCDALGKIFIVDDFESVRYSKGEVNRLFSKLRRSGPSFESKDLGTLKRCCDDLRPRCVGRNASWVGLATYLMRDNGIEGTFFARFGSMRLSREHNVNGIHRVSQSVSQTPDQYKDYTRGVAPKGFSSKRRISRS